MKLSTDINTWWNVWTIIPMDLLVIFSMVAIPAVILYFIVKRDVEQETMEEYRQSIGWQGYPHDGSIEYVLTNSQIREMAKPILFDQDGYFDNEEDK